jgi:hypothetical protein
VYEKALVCAFSDYHRKKIPEPALIDLKPVDSNRISAHSVGNLICMFMQSRTTKHRRIRRVPACIPKR